MAFLGFGKKKPNQGEIDAETARKDNEYRILRDTKNALSSRTWQDIYNTQDKLDSGELASTPGVFDNFETTQKSFAGIKGSKSTSFTGQSVGSLDKDNYYTSVLGGADAIAGYKKKKMEQQGLKNQGIGLSQSILGGSVI